MIDPCQLIIVPALTDQCTDAGRGSAHPLFVGLLHDFMLTKKRAGGSMLTDEALRERKWSWIPALGKILGKKAIPWHYFGPTSASDDYFEPTRRLMEIMILIRENRDEIRAEMTRNPECHSPRSSKPWFSRPGPTPPTG
jgi:hypothetical protein